MRDAVARLGADPTKINPVCPVDLVIDHSVQVDYYGKLVLYVSLYMSLTQSLSLFLSPFLSLFYLSSLLFLSLSLPLCLHLSLTLFHTRNL